MIKTETEELATESSLSVTWNSLYNSLRSVENDNQHVLEVDLKSLKVTTMVYQSLPSKKGNHSY
jgi:hypothetical protein